MYNVITTCSTESFSSIQITNSLLPFHLSRTSKGRKRRPFWFTPSFFPPSYIITPFSRRPAHISLSLETRQGAKVHVTRVCETSARSKSIVGFARGDDPLGETLRSWYRLFSFLLLFPHLRSNTPSRRVLSFLSPFLRIGVGGPEQTRFERRGGMHQGCELSPRVIFNSIPSSSLFLASTIWKLILTILKNGVPQRIFDSILNHGIFVWTGIVWKMLRKLRRTLRGRSAIHRSRCLFDLLARISQHSPSEGGERATCSKLAANAL